VGNGRDATRGARSTLATPHAQSDTRTCECDMEGAHGNCYAKSVRLAAKWLLQLDAACSSVGTPHSAAAAAAASSWNVCTHGVYSSTARCPVCCLPCVCCASERWLESVRWSGPSLPQPQQRPPGLTRPETPDRACACVGVRRPLPGNGQRFDNPGPIRVLPPHALGIASNSPHCAAHGPRPSTRRQGRDAGERVWVWP
jgi:hypothetical protein